MLNEKDERQGQEWRACEPHPTSNKPILQTYSSLAVVTIEQYEGDFKTFGRMNGFCKRLQVRPDLCHRLVISIVSSQRCSSKVDQLKAFSGKGSSGAQNGEPWKNTVANCMIIDNKEMDGLKL